MSWRQSKELKEEQNAATRFAHSMLRRVVVGLTKGRAWQIIGHTIRGVRETVDAEVFGSIGFAARPATDERAEAVLAQLGDARHVVIIATRNEDARKLYDALLVANTSAMFNNTAIVIVKDDETIEARSKDGAAAAVALHAELQHLTTRFNTLVSVFNAHVHAGVTTGAGSSATTATPGTAATAPTGTTVFKAE